MPEQNNNIELRSEKVRNIIGQIPSRIVRIGITVIFTVVFVLLIGAYFFRFDRTMDTPVNLSPENNNIHYTIEVPQNKMKYLQAGQKVTVSINDQVNFDTSIKEIDTMLYVNKHHAYCNVQGVITNSSLKMNEPIKAKARIYTGKTNVIDFVLNR
jgi:hypothetical protein